MGKVVFVIVIFIVSLLIFKDVDRLKLSLEVLTLMSEEERSGRMASMRKRTSQKKLGKKGKKRRFGLKGV